MGVTSRLKLNRKLSVSRRQLIALFLTLITLIIAGNIIYINKDTLRGYDWKFAPGLLVLSFVFYSIGIVLAVFIWGQILDVLARPVPWRDHLYNYCISNLSRRLPLPMAHIGVRLILYPHRVIAPSAISSGSMLEMALMTLSGLFVSIVTGVLRADRSLVRMTIPIIVGGVLCCFLVFYLLGKKRIVPGIKNLSIWRLIGWFLIYGSLWCIGGIAFFFIVQAFWDVSETTVGIGTIINAWTVSGLVALVAAMMPMGLGLRELTLGLLSAEILPQGVAILIAIISRLAFMIYELLWALLSLLLTKNHKVLH